jgi:hypothetical protein
MATFAERYTVSQTAGFKVKAGIAAVLVASQVMTEKAATVVVDRKRRALAMTVLTNPSAITDRFALILAAQDVPADASDESIHTMVWQMWDAIAGIETDDWGPGGPVPNPEP